MLSYCNVFCGLLLKDKTTQNNNKEQKMVNYANGKIYKIVCHKTNKVYVGSTTKPFLCQRLTAHRRDYNRYCNGAGNYVTSFETLDGGNYGIYLLELCPCQSKDELRQRERHYVVSMECVNKNVPGRTRQEYRRANVAAQRENNRQYQQTEVGRANIRAAQRRYKLTDAYRQKDRYRSRMRYHFGDRYCNPLSRITWDCFQ
jgi:hypothetical protein